MPFTSCMAMNDPLLHAITVFLKKYSRIECPVLLAFSGGPDSTALLHVLLEYRKYQPLLKIALAHIDHGWRSESAREAAMIVEMGDELGLTIHLKTLDPKKLKGNLEAACREERLNFFKELCALHGYQAVFLAHHADDLAETVLKRVLEGASLSRFSGLNPQISMNGMLLWRPFLSISKARILTWLQERGLQGFEDSTNEDPKFLRGRFRTSIIPKLTMEFGKDIIPSLCRLSSEAAEVREYLDSRVEVYMRQVKRSKFCNYLDLNGKCPESPYEVKYLIRCLVEMEKGDISRDGLETAAHLLMEGAANKQVIFGSCVFHIDRQRIFLTKSTIQELPKQEVSLRVGETVSFGLWSISVSEETAQVKEDGWDNLLMGGARVLLPKGDYHLAISRGNDPYPRSLPLSKWWTDSKVPAFLRRHVPVIYEGDTVVHEFLTGSRPKSSEDRERDKAYLVSIKLT